MRTTIRGQTGTLSARALQSKGIEPSYANLAIVGLSIGH
jgi:hypothetical protein